MNEQTGRVPKIRFPGFADDWEKRKLDDLCIFEKGKGLSKNDLEEDGKYPCILYGQLFTEYGMFIDTIISKTNAMDDSFKISEEGDVLIPRCDTTPDGLGRATSLSLDGVILGFDINILKIKNRKQLDSKYLSTSLNHHKKELLSKVVGNTVRHLENKEIKDIYIDFPTSLSEQSKIGQLFHAIDNLIPLYQRKLDSIKRCKHGMLQKMFPKEGEKVPEIRFPGFTGDWQQRKLGDVVETVTDFVAAGSFADLRENVTYNDSPDYAQLVRTVDLKNGFTSSSPVYVNKHAFDYLYRVNLDKESIVLPNIGNCGEVYYVRPEMLPYDHNVLGPNAIMVRSDTYDNKFLSILLQGTDFQDKLKLIISPSGQTKFNKTELKEIQIALPIYKDEQERLGMVFSKLDNLITLHQRKLEQIKLYKQGLLQQMFV